MNIAVEPDWHQAIVGTTGSGKTTLLRVMAAGWAAKLNMDRTPSYYKIFILDTKHEGDFDGLGDKVETMQEALTAQSRIVVYSPNDEEDDAAHYELFLRLLWDRWLSVDGTLNKTRVPTVVVIDELSALEISHQTKSLILKGQKHYWGRIMARGRSSKFVLWNATQSPVYNPEAFLRLAHQWFCFRLDDQNDRDKMAGFMGAQVKNKINDEHGFWVKNVKLMEPKYYQRLVISAPPRERVNQIDRNSLVPRHR